MGCAQRRYGAEANRGERLKLIKEYARFCLPLVVDNHEALTV